MTEVLEQISGIAYELGATHARIITDFTYMKAKKSVREACLVNSCGKSGRCWTCPPHLGEFDELREKLLSYEGAVLVQYIAELEDSWDFEGMTEAAVKHNKLIRDLGQRASQLPNLDILSLGCGGCGFCEKCTCPDEPCRSPENALGSVEGYGLDVKALVESVGLNYINGAKTVSYVGMVLVRCG
jgi:predicted metal-binding protein